MPDRSKRMKPIHRLAENNEQEAARELGGALRQLEQQRSQLTQLHAYRQEYMQQFSRQGCAGMNGAQLRDYQSFLENIDRAIHDQQQRILHAEKACSLKKQEWQTRHQRSQVLENAISRFEKDELKQADKRVQRELEDSINARSKTDS